MQTIRHKNHLDKYCVNQEPHEKSLANLIVLCSLYDVPLTITIRLRADM